MSIWDDTLRWVNTGALVIFAVWFFRTYLGGYAAEKGKNLATKEDIAEITSRIEEVKSEHAQSLERSRHDLQLLREDLTSVRSQGRTAIVDFFEALDELLNLARVKIQDTGYETGRDLSEHRHLLQATIGRLFRLHARTSAYFHEDDSLLPLADRARNAAEHFRQAMLQPMSEVAGTAALMRAELGRAVEENRKANSDYVKRNRDAIKSYDEAVTKPLAQLAETYSEFQGALATFFEQRSTDPSA